MGIFGKHTWGHSLSTVTPQISPDKVVELVQAMEDLGIPPGTPRDVGGKLLRDNGFTLSNELYAQAMVMRL